MEITYVVELKPGQPLSLPNEAAQIIGPGRWQISIRPFEPGTGEAVREHSAFLNSFAPEDEGLHDE